MSIEIEKGNDGIVIIRAVGKLGKEDYSSFAAEFERRVRESGKLRVVFDITSFAGWEPDGLWEEVKFDVKHNSDVSRLAVVGDARWQHLLAALSKPFAFGTIRYFDSKEIDRGRRWLME